PRMEILYAAESLVPATGGAERFAVEWLGELAGRHRIRAVWLRGGTDAPEPGEAGERRAPGWEPLPVAPPAPATGYWRGKRERREALAAAVRARLSERPPDVVVTALHAAPAT